MSEIGAGQVLIVKTCDYEDESVPIAGISPSRARRARAFVKTGFWSIYDQEIAFSTRAPVTGNVPSVPLRPEIQYSGTSGHITRCRHFREVNANRACHRNTQFTHSCGNGVRLTSGGRTRHNPLKTKLLAAKTGRLQPAVW